MLALDQSWVEELDYDRVDLLVSDSKIDPLVCEIYVLEEFHCHQFAISELFLESVFLLSELELLHLLLVSITLSDCRQSFLLIAVFAILGDIIIILIGLHV